MKTVGPKKIGHIKRDLVGYGYVIIPNDTPRDEYILNCYRTKKIILVTESSEQIDEASVTEQSFDFIKFPQKQKELGSLCVYVCLPKHKHPIVIGTITAKDEYISFEPTEFEFKKTWRSNIVQMFGDAKRGILSLLAKAEGTQLNISVQDKTNKAIATIQVDGDTSINVRNELSLKGGKKIAFEINSSSETKSTSLSYESEIGFTYKDEFGNEWTINKDFFEINHIKKISLGKDGQPIPLGENLHKDLLQIVNYLSAINTVIKSTPIPEPGSGSPSAFQQALSAALATINLPDLQNILSKYSFTK